MASSIRREDGWTVASRRFPRVENGDPSLAKIPSGELSFADIPNRIGVLFGKWKCTVVRKGRTTVYTFEDRDKLRRIQLIVDATQRNLVRGITRQNVDETLQALLQNPPERSIFKREGAEFLRPFSASREPKDMTGLDPVERRHPFFSTLCKRILRQQSAKCASDDNLRRLESENSFWHRMRYARAADSSDAPEWNRQYVSLRPNYSRVHSPKSGAWLLADVGVEDKVTDKLGRWSCSNHFDNEGLITFVFADREEMRALYVYAYPGDRPQFRKIRAKNIDLFIERLATGAVLRPEKGSAKKDVEMALEGGSLEELLETMSPEEERSLLSRAASLFVDEEDSSVQNRGPLTPFIEEQIEQKKKQKDETELLDREREAIAEYHVSNHLKKLANRIDRKRTWESIFTFTDYAGRFLYGEARERLAVFAGKHSAAQIIKEVVQLLSNQGVIAIPDDAKKDLEKLIVHARSALVGENREKLEDLIGERAIDSCLEEIQTILRLYRTYKNEHPEEITPDLVVSTKDSRFRRELGERIIIQNALYYLIEHWKKRQGRHERSMEQRFGKRWELRPGSVKTRKLD